MTKADCYLIFNIVNCLLMSSCKIFLLIGQLHTCPVDGVPTYLSVGCTVTVSAMGYKHIPLFR